MAQGDLAAARADDPARRDELRLAERQELAADDTGRVWPAQQADDRDHRGEPRPDDRDEDDAQQDQRDRQQRVGEAHDHLVADPAGEPGDHPERRCRRSCRAPRPRSRRSSEIRVPWTTRARMSRPDRSAPSRWPGAGRLADRAVVGLERVERDEERQDHRDRHDRPRGSRRRRSPAGGAGTAGWPCRAQALVLARDDLARQRPDSASADIPDPSDRRRRRRSPR